jgi:hypothetical protein
MQKAFSRHEKQQSSDQCCQDESPMASQNGRKVRRPDVFGWQWQEDSSPDLLMNSQQVDSIVRQIPSHNCRDIISWIREVCDAREYHRSHDSLAANRQTSLFVSEFSRIMQCQSQLIVYDSSSAAIQLARSCMATNRGLNRLRLQEGFLKIVVDHPDDELFVSASQMRDRPESERPLVICCGTQENVSL